MALQKRMSSFSLLFAATGGIVGSGWLLGPFFTAQVAGPAALISWLLGGLLMMVIALTFAELATMFPEAGGMVRFAHYSHGPFASFTIAWISWLAAVMVAPIETMAALQYAGNYLSGLTVLESGKHVLTLTGIGFAAGFMLLMCAINYFGVHLFSKSNNLLVSWKLIIPVIAIGYLVSNHFDTHNFIASGFAPYGLKGILSALPTAGVIFSFIGYSPAIQLAGEAKNPQKAVPFAIVGAIVIAIILYVAVEISFVGVLVPADFATGWAHLHFKGDAGPIAGVLSAFGVLWFVKVIYVDAVISPLGTAFIYTASTSRVNMAMSKNGFMPGWMQKMNGHGVPYLAIGINFIVGMIFFLPFPGWQAMVSYLVSCFVLAYAAGPIACAALRARMPKQKRPFKIPFYKPFCLLGFYICNLIVLWTGWDVVWKMLVTIAIGYVILFLSYRKDLSSLEGPRGIWMVPYLFGTGLISWLSSFGGLNIIPFGYDFLVVACFSIVIFWYALLLGEK